VLFFITKENIMHRILPVLALLVLLVLVSCSSKQKMANEASSMFDLTGTWELREAQNGMMPNTTYAAGNGNYFTFTATTFEEYRDGSLARKGSYTLVPDTTASETVGLELPKGQFTHRIVFAGDTTEKTFVHLRGREMTLVTGFFPVDSGSKQTFAKKENNR
jgi:hypothetical protein